jgi:hypothetical protein
MILNALHLPKNNINNISALTRKSRRYKQKNVINPISLFGNENVRIFGDKENPIFSRKKVSGNPWYQITDSQIERTK